MDYGLIGEKLGHSFSKVIHEDLTDYTYDLCPLTKDEFKIFMEEKAFKAINVTIPYKESVIPYLSEIDEHAKAIGAVNTIINKDGNLHGYNTDYLGFQYMLDKYEAPIAGSKCLVIGSGGASKAIIAALTDNAAKEIIVVDIVEKPGVISYEECFANHTDVDVIVNTSPVGMFPNVDNQPVDLCKFPNCKTVLDVIYNPIETKLTAQAKELGMKAATGLEMLVAQALYAVELFRDTTIPKERIEEIYDKVKEML